MRPRPEHRRCLQCPRQHRKRLAVRVAAREINAGVDERERGPAVRADERRAPGVGKRRDARAWQHPRHERVQHLELIAHRPGRQPTVSSAGGDEDQRRVVPAVAEPLDDVLVRDVGRLAWEVELECQPAAYRRGREPAREEEHKPRNEHRAAMAERPSPDPPRHPGRLTF